MAMKSARTFSEPRSRDAAPKTSGVRATSPSTTVIGLTLTRTDRESGG